MSSETFRAEFAFNLSAVIQDSEQLHRVLDVLDSTMAGYEVRRACTDLIVYDGVPVEVRNYIASKSIENCKKGTLANYYAILRDFFEQVRKPVESVTASDARLFLAWYKKTRNVKDNTLDHKRIMLNSFFEWLVDEDDNNVRKNPMRHVKPIQYNDDVRLPMTALELEKVRKACKTIREKALVDFMYSTAARVSEVCALNISDVNFTEHTVFIKHGKGDKDRVTFLNPESEVSLKAYLATRDDDCPALFVQARGAKRHLNKKTVETEIKNIVSRCELSVHVTPHIFRHTAASLALKRGMPIDQVQKFLGHARIQTTLRYAKVLDFDVKLSHQRYVA